MVTTRRSTRETASGSFATGVGVLERPASYEEFVTAPEKEKCPHRRKNHNKTKQHELCVFSGRKGEKRSQQDHHPVPVACIVGVRLCSLGDRCV